MVIDGIFGNLHRALIVGVQGDCVLTPLVGKLRFFVFIMVVPKGQLGLIQQFDKVSIREVYVTPGTSESV
jgi:hypothetical protein